MKGTLILRKEFITRGDIVTEGLPTNWSIDYRQLNEVEYAAKLTFINTSEQFEAIDIVTYYTIKQEYVDATEGGQVFYSTIDGEENLLHTDADQQPNYHGLASKDFDGDFTGSIKFVFTWYIPEPSPLTFAGYDFSENNPTNDQILAVGGEKFYVNKAVLSLYSPVLNNLFNNGNFEESKKEEIELNDIKASEFKVLLHMIFPTTVSVNGKRQTPHLNLSHRLKIAQALKSDKLMLAVSDAMAKLKI